jgi:heme-degrading monooxygenase HmoA
MFCRLFIFKFHPENREGVHNLAKNAEFFMRQNAGFVSVNFFADWEHGEGGAMSLWNSREDIEAYRNETRGIMRIAATGLFLEPPKVVVAEIIEPAD